MNHSIAGTMDLLGHIYEAALEPGQWTKVLEMLSRITNSESGLLVAGSFDRNCENQYANYNIDREWVDAYNDYYYMLDPSIEIFSRNPGKILVDHVIKPEQALDSKAREFYQSCMLPQQYYHTLGCSLEIGNGLNDALILQRTRQQGPYEKPEIAFLAGLREHFSRALRIYRGMRMASKIRSSMEVLMERLRSGVIIIDTNGVPIFFNNTAEQLAGKTGAYYINSNSIRARFMDENIKLEAFVRDAVYQYTSRNNSTSGGNLDLKGRDGRPAVNMVIAPLNPDLSSEKTAQDRGAVALLISPLADSSDSLEQVLSLYNLTRAEKRLCKELMHGVSLAEIADNIKVSKNTLRSQLRSVFAKTGTSRQPELVRFLLQLTT